MNTVPAHTGLRDRALLLLTVLVAGINLYQYRRPENALDDAWISFRIARNLVEHGVLTYDLNLPPVEGMTNMLWTLMSAVWIFMFPALDPIIVARMLGALLFLATVILTYSIVLKLQPASHGNRSVPAFMSSLLVASNGSLAYHSMSGLETSLWMALFAFSLWLVHQILHGNARARIHLLATLCALAITRPEGVLLSSLILAGLWLLDSHRSAVVRLMLGYGLFVALIECFRFLYFGDLLPNTYYAKPPSGSLGINYLLSYLLFGVAVIGVFPIFLAPTIARMTILIAGIAVVMAAGAVLSGGDWMPGFRRFTITTLCIYVLAGISLCHQSRYWQVISGAAIAAMIVMNIYTASSDKFEFGRFTHRSFAVLGQTAEASSGVSEVALLDIGNFGWHFSGSVFDVAGLTDQHLARLPRQDRESGSWDEAYFRERSPELVVIAMANVIDPQAPLWAKVRSQEQPMLNSLLLRGGYTYHAAYPLAETTYLYVFVRNDLRLDEEQWGPRRQSSYFTERGL